jgi:drug/metabolite transporter (DMT)-like permease
VLTACFVGTPPDLTPMTEGNTPFLLLAVGVSATLGQLCVTKAFTYGQPARVSVIALSQVVFALALDLLIDDVTLLPVTVAGIALVLAPTAWMMLGGLARRSATAPKEELAQS